MPARRQSRPYSPCARSGLRSAPLFAFGTVVLRADQVLCGIALTFLGVGLAAWIGRPYSGQIVRAQLEALPIPLLSDIPVLGPRVV